MQSLGEVASMQDLHPAFILAFLLTTRVYQRLHPDGDPLTLLSMSLKEPIEDGESVLCRQST